MKRYIVFVLTFFLFAFANAQLTQPESISLDGTWSIIFDHDNEGQEGNWHLADTFNNIDAVRTINVPSSWETIEQDYEGVAFYKYDFDVPATWENSVISLQFAAVNYIAEVWLNGEAVGYHEGGFTPFEFRVDEIIKVGENNVLTLRVLGPIILTDKRIDGIGKLETPTWRGGITGGVWQSVKIVASGNIYVKDVFIKPDIAQNTATFEIELDNAAIMGTEALVLLKINEKGSHNDTIYQKELLSIIPGVNRMSRTLSIPDAKYWSPDSPTLYTANVKIFVDGELSDQWSANFGMCELTIRNEDFYLNGKPVYIKATFFEGLYPNGIAAPDSREMAIREIRLAKEAGFNMIRPWRHPPTPMWLDLADEMGVMVVGSPVLECMRLPLSTPYLPARVENEIRQAVLRDRNRASVVQWELFNELHRPVLKQMMRPMALVTREIDPTRLILDESGGWAYGANMYLPEETEPTKFNDIHTYPGPFMDKNLFDGFLSVGMTAEEKNNAGLKARGPGRNVVPGLMSFISELGYGSLPELESNVLKFEEQGNPLTPAYRYHKRLAEEQREMIALSGFSELYPRMEQFYLDQQWIHGEANRRMIEAARSNPEVDGYCIHALVAGDWILGAGLLDMWRNPKSHVYDATKAANQSEILVIRAIPRNVYASSGTTVEIKGISELETKSGYLKFVILDTEGNNVFTRRIDTDLGKGVNELLKTHFDTKALKGNYTLLARYFSEKDELITENQIEIDVFTEQDLTKPEHSIAVMDFNGALTKILNKQQLDHLPFKNSIKKTIPVFVSGYNQAKNLEEDSFKDLLNFASKGGTVVFIEELGIKILEDKSLLPFEAVSHRARGLWTCIPHLVQDHPVFSGLPSNEMMDDIYENVWANNTLMDIESPSPGAVKPIVASVGFDWFSQNHKMHYSGPGSSWWGSDVVEIPHGKGRLIISQLRLLNSLGNDPVADKILYNFIRFAAGQ